MSLNAVVLCGRITDAGPKISYLPSGQPEALWTLILEDGQSKDGKLFRLFMPVVAYGDKSEAWIEHLSAGDLVTIQGRLC